VLYGNQQSQGAWDDMKKILYDLKEILIISVILALAIVYCYLKIKGLKL